MKRLTAEGTVTAAAHRGFHVSPLLSAEELPKMLSARPVIETAVLEMAPGTCAPAEVQQLSAMESEMDALNAAEVLDTKTFNATDAAFHRLTVSLSGNRFLLSAFDSLHAHVQIARFYQGRSVEEARSANIEHHRLLAAFAAGNGEAAAHKAGLQIDGVLARLQDRVDELPHAPVEEVAR